VSEKIYIVDSNVVRGASKQAGLGKYTLSELHARGAVSVPGDVIVELCTCIDSEREFFARKATAAKIGAANLFVLPQSSIYIRWLYGRASAKELTADLDMWAGNLAWLSQLSSFDAWKNDESFQKLSKERSDGYRAWADSHKEEFQKMAELSKSGMYQDLTGNPQKDRALVLSKIDFPKQNVQALEFRVTGGDPSLVSASNRSFAESHLKHYGKLLYLYQKEVFLLDGGMVGKNDRGDIDIMVFAAQSSPLFPGRDALIVTREPDWLRLVNDAYPVKMAFDPLELVSSAR
jgi:hypothetical protein